MKILSSFRIAALFAAILLAQPALSTGANAEQPEEARQLDPTCTAVNEAYGKTRRSKEYSEIIYQGNDDRSLRPYLEYRFTKTASFQKFVFSPGNRWVSLGPEDWPLFDQHGPKFTDCSFVESATIGAEPTLHYTAKWHSFPANAYFNVWVSGADGRMVKTMRRYFETQDGVRVDEFNYNPASAVVPPDH
jgi:hypothetical protein